jgi:hypothetical protein
MKQTTLDQEEAVRRSRNIRSSRDDADVKCPSLAPECRRPAAVRQAHNYMNAGERSGFSKLEGQRDQRIISGRCARTVYIDRVVLALPAPAAPNTGSQQG